MNEEDTKKYITDLLDETGVKQNVLEEGRNKAQEENSEFDVEQHYQDYIDEVYKSMNRNNDNVIKKEFLLIPNNQLSQSFMNLSSQFIKKKQNNRSRLLKSSNLKKSTLQPRTEVMKGIKFSSNKKLSLKINIL